MAERRLWCLHARSVYLLGVTLTPSLGDRVHDLDRHRAVGTVVLGILAFGEPADLRRLAYIGLILAGIVGLKLVSAP